MTLKPCYSMNALTVRCHRTGRNWDKQFLGRMLLLPVLVQRSGHVTWKENVGGMSLWVAQQRGAWARVEMPSLIYAV
jgi:hypothetical protein